MVVIVCGAWRMVCGMWLGLSVVIVVEALPIGVPQHMSRHGQYWKLFVCSS